VAMEDTAVVVPANEAVPDPLLRHAREAQNLTQDEVADGLIRLGAKGVTGGLVSKWERGICRPNRFHRRLLCQFFSATLEDLGFRARVQPSGLGGSEEALVDEVAPTWPTGAPGVGATWRTCRVVPSWWQPAGPIMLASEGRDADEAPPPDAPPRTSRDDVTHARPSH